MITSIFYFSHTPPPVYFQTKKSILTRSRPEVVKEGGEELNIKITPGSRARRNAKKLTGWGRFSAFLIGFDSVRTQGQHQKAHFGSALVLSPDHWTAENPLVQYAEA